MACEVLVLFRLKRKILLLDIIQLALFCSTPFKKLPIYVYGMYLHTRPEKRYVRV
jgi:hypothetical protein